MVGFVKSALNLFGLNHKGAEGGELNIDEFVDTLPKLMGYDVQIKKVEENEAEGVYHFEVHGAEADSLLGDTSDMLDAMAHLCMRIIRKNRGLSNAPASEGGESIRVVFDANGFRDRKAQELKDLAANQRNKVIETGGKPAYISALGPSERKVIHTHLADLGDVVSESIGRGNFKRIRVRLKEDSPHYKAPAERQPGQESQPRHGGQPGRDGGGRGRRNNGGDRGPRANGRDGGSGGNGRGRRGGGPDRNNGGARRPEGQNGNFNRVEPVVQERLADDNIGNRLRPGEEPLFNYSGANKGDGGGTN